MKKLTILTLLALTLAAPCMADSILNVDSDITAQVILDDEPLGTTPVLIKGVKPGVHTMKVVDPRTSLVREYNIYSPRSVTIQKDLFVTFGDVPVPATAPAAHLAPPPGAAQGSAIAPPPASAHPKGKNKKARFRNIVLGGALVNEVFNNSRKGKKTVRKGLLGAGLLNELLNR